MDYSKVEVIPSKGSSGAVVPIKDNILLPDSIEWPPSELIGKLYQSNHLGHFDEKYHGKLTQELGYYCDLESIRSEDAITWSLFGYISKMEYKVQNKFYNEFLEKIKCGNDELLSIELWKTLPHPETHTSKGPEIDVFILGKKFYILIECKWTSGIGKNQGAKKDLDQMQIRNLFKDGIGKKLIPGKKCKIVLVANEKKDNNEFVSWDTLSTFSSLPHKELFKKYLEWKKRFI
jgi:hypothetical protein